MDIFVFISSLIFTLFRIFYFFLLLCLTIEDIKKQHESETEQRNNNPLKLFTNTLLIAGALWLWSHMGFFFVGFLLTTIVILELELDRDDSELHSSMFLGFRFVFGVVWIWSHKKVLLIASIFALLVYVSVIMLRDAGFGIANKNVVEIVDPDTTHGPPTTQGGAPDPNPIHAEELVGTTSSSGCDSDGSVVTRQSLWRAMVGQNVNVGGGTQTIGGVSIGDFGIRVEINNCRDVIIRSLRRYRSRSND